LDMNEKDGEILRIDNVSYQYEGGIEALSEVTVAVAEGEILAIIGSNGSGKSSLLHVMNGLTFPTSGKVLFRGMEVSERSLRDCEFLRFFRGDVGYVFQDSDVQLFCPTVFDELMFGPLQLGLSEFEARSRSAEILEMLEIADLTDRPSYMLSSGEKKRVAIGAILTMNPDLLLLDEPTSGLDPRSQSYLVELMLALNQAGKTIVIATHDLSLVSELQGRVAVLSETHRLVRVGEADEVLGDKDLLLEVNLIHEHVHFHGAAAHRHVHSHYLFHRHNGGHENDSH
jgi:cobalt/nickel transport system ATP-binding protein